MIVLGAWVSFGCHRQRGRSQLAPAADSTEYVGHGDGHRPVVVGDFWAFVLAYRSALHRRNSISLRRLSGLEEHWQKWWDASSNDLYEPERLPVLL